MDNYLVMKDITKVYDNGIMANDHVNFEARQGETADDEAAMAEAANATEEAEPTDIEEVAAAE